MEPEGAKSLVPALQAMPGLQSLYLYSTLPLQRRLFFRVSLPLRLSRVRVRCVCYCVRVSLCLSLCVSAYVCLCFLIFFLSVGAVCVQYL